MTRTNLFKRLLGSGERREESRVRAEAGTRLLVVDDSPTIRAVLAKMLIQDGYAVLKAADGNSALEIARQEKPDAIFLDIVLPGMNGFAVLRTLRRDRNIGRIPIVMMSGNLQATEQYYVQRLGADIFMKKPFGRAEVFNCIRELVEAGHLPERVTEVPEAHTTIEGMEHIPDVALPDDELEEHEVGAGARPELRVVVAGGADEIIADANQSRGAGQATGADSQDSLAARTRRFRFTDLSAS